MYNYDFSWDRPEPGIENLPMAPAPAAPKIPGETGLDLTGGTVAPMNSTPAVPQMQAGQNPWGTLGRFDQPGAQGKWVTGYNEIGGGDAGSQLVEKKYWDYGNPNVRQSWDFGMGYDEKGGPNLTNSGTGDELVDIGGKKYLRMGNWQEYAQQQAANPNPNDPGYDWSKIEYDPTYGYIMPMDAIGFDTGWDWKEVATPIIGALGAAMPYLSSVMAPALSTALGISQGAAGAGFNLVANTALNGGRVNPLSALNFGGQLLGVPPDILSGVNTAGKVYNTYNQIKGATQTPKTSGNDDARRRAAYQAYLQQYYAKLGKGG